jgi:HlyD family secretion protein
VRAEPAPRTTNLATIDTDGKVEPVGNIEAHAPAAGVVERILVQEGQQVKAGEMLLRMDDAYARAEAARALTQVRAAEAELAAMRAGGTREEVLSTQTDLKNAQAEQNAAERNLEALGRLQQRGAASAAEVREAERRLEAARAGVELLEKKLKSRFAEPELERAQARLSEARATYQAAQNVVREANVRAARAGTVYSLPVRQGQFVQAGELLVQVAGLEEVLVRAFVDEPEIGRLRQGQEVVVTWNALPEESWKGTITRLPAAVVTRGTRSVGEVVCTIENRERRLLPNVNVSVSVVTAREANVLTVPREAVRRENGQSYVFVIENGELQRRRVETGISNLTRMEIEGGLSEGAMVVTGSVTGAALSEGMAVRAAES